MTACRARSTPPSASTESSAMFDTATSVSGRPPARASSICTVSSIPFATAFWRATWTACGSTSTAVTGAKPSFTAAIAMTPEPQPTSTRLPRGSSASSSRQRRVVGWAPVPNARPGSTTTGIRPGGGSSHGGPTQSGPTRAPRWKRRQRSCQSAGTSRPATAPKTAAKRSWPAPSVYATSSTPSEPSTSSKPSGKSSSICARAGSARSMGTETETRRSVSGTRSSACRRSPRRRRRGTSRRR